MTFGFTTWVDLLSWIVALSLALKVAATLALLVRPVSSRLATTSGRLLWWVTKVTPVIAIPCLVLIAWLTGDRAGLFGYSLLLLFVAIAVPLAIATRHRGSLLGQLSPAAPAPHTPLPPSRWRR